jgi:Ca2+-binding EF-hand superfamily protein
MTMKPLGLVLAIGVAAMLAAPAAQARGDGKGMRLPAFETLDLNKDGKIDRDESKQMVQGRWQAADADGDGAVTLEELRAHMTAEAARRAEQNAARVFERLDANKDGKIGTEELEAMAERRDNRIDRMFNRLDRDEDGAISQAEYDRMAERMQRRGEGRDGKRQGRMYKN